jgi:hypothetical protein
MNVQASTCDGLLAPYKHASSVLFSKPMPATRPTGSQTGPPERKAPDQQRRQQHHRRSGQRRRQPQSDQ